jgi:excisionase family DNA binding protein
LRNKDFDPLAYIESGFLDTRKSETIQESQEVDGDGVVVTIPTLKDFLKTGTNGSNGNTAAPTKAVVADPGEKSKRFKRTTMSAPRPRRAKDDQKNTPIDPELQEIWELLPKNMDFLCSFYDDSVTKNYYRGEFKETRQALVKRLLDPELSLEETSRLLGVCPATVRRYTNRSWLKHHRTTGGQRRFRLSDVVRFVNEHGRFPEES